MNWQSRLEKTVIALNLIGLALGFGTLGLLILVKGEHAGESWISGVLGMVVGSLFLLFAFYFCKHTRGGGSERSAFASYSRISPVETPLEQHLTGLASVAIARHLRDR